MNKALPALFIASTLAACGPKAPEVTDDDLQTLLGDRHYAHRILMIGQDAVDCLYVLSGSSDELIEEKSVQYVAMQRPLCRQEINKRLRDENRNPLGLEMALFEKEETALRVESIRQLQLEIINIEQKKQEAARTEEKKREIERLIQGNTERLAEAKANATEHVLYVANWMKEMEPLCAEYSAVKAEVESKGIKNPQKWKLMINKPCDFSRIERDAEKGNAEIQTKTYDPEKNIYLSVATPFHWSQKSYLAEKHQETVKVIEDLKTLLSENDMKN